MVCNCNFIAMLEKNCVAFLRHSIAFSRLRKNSWNSYHELFMITRFETRIIFDVVAKNAKRFDLGKGREIFQSIWKVVDKR